MQPSLVVKQRLKRRQRHQRSPLYRTGQGALGIGMILSLLLAGSVIFLAVLYADLTAGLPSLQQLPVLLDPKNGQFLQPTRFYDRTGHYVLFSLENPGIPKRSLSIDPDQPAHFSPQLVQVTVALLQPDFWQSPGFSWNKMTLPAPLTIAERLVDDLLLVNEPSGLRRALRMRLLAGQLVSTYGRGQVLEWYLNSTSYGHLAYGAESAAQLYLGKSASQLDMAEAALLVPIAEAPALNPLDARAAALERQQSALERLKTMGLITAEQVEKFKPSGLALKEAPSQQIPFAVAYNRLVLDRLEARLGRKTLERGGLRVITSLDYDLQTQLACTVSMQLARLEGRKVPAAAPCEAGRLLPSLSPDLSPLPPALAASGALVDLQSGQLLAFLGDQTLSGESAQVTSHQPGSLLTPLVAMAAFARGFGPASLVWDIPSSLPPELAGRQNPDGKFHGPQRLRMALANDYLVPIAQILEQIGPVNVWRLAEPLGVNGLQDSDNPADLLFAGGHASLLEIAQAYSSFADQGFQPAASYGQLSALVLDVEDVAGNRLLGPAKPEQRSVLSPQLAFLVHHVLRDDTARWPSLGYPNPLEIGRPAGAKIGQADNAREMWTVGYSSQRLLVIWLGLPVQKDATVHLAPSMVAGIWHALMQYAQRDLPVADWSTPAGITQREVCDPSGLLPSVDCPLTVDEVFLEGNEPTEVDNLYRKLQINRETQRLATVFTPPELVDEQTFLVVPYEAQEWARLAGLPLPPTDYDVIQAPSPLADVQISVPPIFATVRGKISIQGTASGEGFSSYRLQVGQGLNPRNWLQIGEESRTPLKGGVLGVWDSLSQSDGLYAIRLIVVRQDQRLDTAIIQVTVDNTPPVVRIYNPAPDQHFRLSEESQINLQAEASDSSGIQQVDWYVDGRRVGVIQQAPFSFPWPATVGKHIVQAKVYDLAGNESVSQEVVIYFDP